MFVQRWLQSFIAFEARNGGALPLPQLFPFLAASETATAVDDVSVGGNDKTRGAASTLAAAPTRDDTSEASDAALSPPPPPGPPPAAAMTTVTAATVSAPHATTTVDRAGSASPRLTAVRDAGCGTTAPDPTAESSAVPLIYSRYVFLRVVTGLQLLWGYFSVALWNYAAHVRWHYSAASLVDSTTGNATSLLADGEKRMVAGQWLAPAYLAVALAGLTYTVSAVVYVCVVNTPWHVRAAYPHPHLLMKACSSSSSSAAAEAGRGRDPDTDPFLTHGPLLRRRRMRQSSLSLATTASDAHGAAVADDATCTTPEQRPPAFTQPQFLFPLRYLAALDLVAARAVEEKSQAAAYKAATASRATFATVPRDDIGLSYPQPQASYPPHHQQVQQLQLQQGPRLFEEAPLPPSASSPSPYGPQQALPHYRTVSWGEHAYQLVPPPRPPQHHRGDPKAALLWCALPLVVALTVFDFLVMRRGHMLGWPVRFLQGLTPALGLLLCLWTLKSVAVLCVRSCAGCSCDGMSGAVYQPAHPPTNAYLYQQHQSAAYGEKRDPQGPVY